MKAIFTIFCLFFGSLLYSQTVIQVQDFSAVTIPDFPSGFAPSTGASLNWNTSIQSSDTIARCPRGGGSGVTYVLETQTFSSVGYVNVIFSFNRRAQGSTSGSNALRKIFVEWSNNNGGTWFTVDSVSATTGAFSTYNSSILGASADGNSTLKFRFTLGANLAAANIANAFWIDDIAIKGDLTTATEFFSKPTGLLDNLTTWGSNTNGTGTQPISFNEPDYIFHVANNSAATIGSDLLIDGVNAQFIIEAGANFIIPNGLVFDTCASCAVVDIQTGGGLIIETLNTASYPKIGGLATGSTINYGGTGNQTVLGSPIVYENLVISGSGNKTCEAGKNVRVNGSFDVQTGNTFILHKTIGNTNNFNLFGSSSSSGEIDGNIHSRLVIDGPVVASGNLKFKAGSIIGLLDFQAINTVLATESNLSVRDLRFSNVGNQSILQILGVSKLTISGEVTGNPTFSGNADAELEINGTGVNSFNLSIQTDVGDPFLNAFKNFTLNRNITITLANEMKVLNDVNIQTGTLASSGNLTLLSDAISTGRILALNPPASDVTGSVNISRFNPGGFTGWVTMASPVKGSLFSDIDDDLSITCPSCPDGTGAGGSDFTSVYSFDETQSGQFDDFNSYVPLSDISESFRNGTGYYVYVGDGTINTNDISFNVTGAIASEEVRLQLTATPGFNGSTFDPAHDGLNLVGNPYPAPIDWMEVFNVTSTDDANGADPIFDSYYIYSADEAGGAGGFYSYVDGSSQTPGLMDDGIIPLGQAFFVQSQGPAGRVVDLVINETCKSAANTAFFLKTVFPPVTKKQDCYFKLTRYSDAKSTATTITFKAEATTNVDFKYDGLYKSALPTELSVNPKAMIFYTVLNGTKYSINALPPINGQMQLDLFTKVGTTGLYSISADNLTAIPEGYCIDLFDKSTNTHHDLKISDYMCTLNKNDNNSRFTITFSNATFKISTIANEPLCNSEANGEITVKVKGNGPYNYTWRDANNQIVAKTINSTSNSNTVKDLFGGTYKVEVSKPNQCSVASEKVSIQGLNSAVADFTIPENIRLGANGQVSVGFTNLSQQANAYTWNFGDGKTNSDQTDAKVMHTYTKAGVYKVTLQVFNDNCSDAAVISKYISVQDPFAVNKNLEQVKMWKDMNDNLRLVFDNIVDAGSIEIYNLVGQKLFDYSFKNNQNKEIVIKNISETITHQIGVVKLKSNTNQVTKRIAF